MEIMNFDNVETDGMLFKLEYSAIKMNSDDEGGFISFYLASFASVANQIEDLLTPDDVNFQFSLNGFIDRVDLEIEVVDITSRSMLLGAEIKTTRLVGSGISHELYDSQNVGDLAFRVPLDKMYIHIHELLGVHRERISNFYLAREPIDVIRKFYALQEHLGGVETQEIINSQVKGLIDSLENNLAEQLLG